jgi:hypothetical protein
MPRLNVRAAILSAMMTNPDKAWTRRELVDATGYSSISISKSCGAAVTSKILDIHRGAHPSHPVSYTLTELGRKWGIVFAGEQGLEPPHPPGR